jgi:phage terminase large subunit GpA-like protein
MIREAASVVAAARQALKPPPRLKLSGWADEHFYLSAESSAEPGRWSTLPYQREPMDAMTDTRVAEVTFMKSARVGYTKMLNALIGYHIVHDPCSILLVQPTEDDAKGYSKEEIEPLLRDVPEIGERFVKARNQLDSLLHKRFKGGILQLAGARSPGNFRRVSRRVILEDEIDGYPMSAGKEGDPLKLAERRAEYFWNRKVVRGSTPTDQGSSRVEEKFLEGDQRRCYVPCPHCQGMQVLAFANFRWPDAQPELAVCICIHCGCEIDHAHKRGMVERCEWRPGPHAQFPKVAAPPAGTTRRSYHIWAAYSFSPNASWGQIAKEFLEAKHAGVEQLKTFVNTVLGETWADRGEAPDWELLYQRREAYEVGSCPMGVLFLTAAVDVQRDRLIYEVVGWGRGKESWSIDAGVVPGDTSDLTGGAWLQLDTLLDRDFPHAGGSKLRIRMLAVDSGDQTQTVYNWVRTKDGSRVIPVKGNDSANVLVGSPTKVDVSVKGKKVGKLLLWRVGGPIAKSELYGWLRLGLPTDEARDAGATTPPGYCHFPEYGEAYFKQLTAEQLVPRRDQKGFVWREWALIPGRENHWLDCRVYARAAAAVVGLDRSKESDFAALERALGIHHASPSVPEPSAPVTPPAAPRQPAAGRSSKQPWLGRRQGSWLKGRR